MERYRQRSHVARVLVCGLLSVIALLSLTGATMKDCAGDGGTGNPPVIGAPKKGQHLALEVDWPEGRKSPVTISYNVPEGLSHGSCPTGYRLVHRVDPPLVCDFDGYVGGRVTITALQNEPGLMTCEIFLGAWHREVEHKSTRKAGDLLHCELKDVGPVA